jgi:phage-related protein
MAAPRFTLEFYTDATGRKPVLAWLRNKASVSTRRVVGTALREILQEQGMGVCGTAFGRQLGGGLFEFRLRESDLLLRAFCHAYGDKVILLLAAYDKSEDPSAKRQKKEIELARRRLTDWQQRQRRS